MNPFEPRVPTFESARSGRAPLAAEIDALMRNDLFRGVEPGLAARASGTFLIARLQPGALLYRRWHVSTTVFLVLGGRIELERSGPSLGALELATVEPGGFCGEDAFFPGLRPLHRMDARCVEPSIISFAPAVDLEPLLEAGPEVALNLARSLADRLETLVDRMTKATPFACDGGGRVSC